MKKIIMALLVMSLISMFLIGCQDTTEEVVGTPNPASTNCVDEGGEVEIKDGEGGQYGLCNFDDGSVCEEWDLFNGDCEKGAVFADLTNCESYFDGCNTCMVANSTVMGCTMMACDEGATKDAKCLKYKIPENCVSWFDGCNTCAISADSPVQACTAKFCSEEDMQEPKCLEFAE